MTLNSSTTPELVESYHRDRDDHLLLELYERHRDWVHGYVRRRMTDVHRKLDASEDVVQETFMALFRQGPAFVPPDDDTFRRLVGTIVVNRLHNRFRFLTAQRRDHRQEAGNAALEVSHLAPSIDSAEAPARAVEAAEERQLVALALELIDPDDAEVVRLRNDDDLGFAEIAERLGIGAGAARMRFNRALLRVGEVANRLAEGNYEGLERADPS